MKQQEIRVLSPTAILGYGFPIASFEAGMGRKPHVIAVDAGSTDPGPYYLGAGKSFTSRAAVKRDLEIIITAGASHNIPVIIGTAGGAGANVHLKWCLEIIEEVIQENNLKLPVADIESEIPREELLNCFERGNLKQLFPGPAPEREELEQSTAVVAQMGLEPFIKALEGGARLIVAGRAYDPAVFACYPVWQGFDRALSLHMGKILECASIATEPGSGSDCMIGYLREDHFLLEPLNLARKCTVTSVAAHTLYEKSDPRLLPGPGGTLDLSETTFEQVNERIVRVAGSKFIPVVPYTLKLEGARQVGYRTISIAGARDPLFIENVEGIIKGVRERVDDNFSALSGQYQLIFRLYGRDGVMGEMEPVAGQGSCHELGIIIEVIASTQADADTICGFARSTMLHYGYPGRKTTAGNLAFPYSPSDFKGGEVYQFSVHCLMEVKDPLEFFPVHFRILT